MVVAAVERKSLLLGFKDLGFEVQGLPFRDITPIMENQMEKQMENEMETLGSFKVYMGGCQN